jgi:fluoride ion exporter CrcB/FEX
VYRQFWLEHSPNGLLRPLLVTGLLGGFTTFSAFSVESLILLHRGQFLLALGHTLAHVLGAPRLRRDRLSSRRPPSLALSQATGRLPA